MPDSKNKSLIFLSHASEDKPIVQRLCKQLRQDGFDPWLDEERLLPGQAWNLEIEKALRDSNAILLCFSAHSVQKEGYIQREYKQAMKYQEEKPEGSIFVIPVRLDNCEMPLFIKELQWVDYPEQYDRLVIALKQRMGKGDLYQESEYKSQDQTKRVEIILEGEFSEFTPSRQQDIVRILAAVLQVEANQIRVLNVYQGSIKIIIEMPDITANRLYELARINDFIIRSLGIKSVSIESRKIIKLSDKLEKTDNEPKKIHQKLGKLSLAILENFVESKLGEDFVKELRSDFNLNVTLEKALENTEKRFLKESTDQDLARAMFVDLSQKNRPSLNSAIAQFYQHPSDSNFQNVLSEVLLGEFQTLSQERVESAVTLYVDILIEEMALLDIEFREKVRFLVDFRQDRQKEEPSQKIAPGTYQIPPLPPQGVLGREDELKTIADLLALEATEEIDMQPVALRGMGGIGKTTLALAFAHHKKFQAALPDGILWTSLGPKPTPRLLLDDWGKALGIDLLPERDEAACQTRLRQLLHERRMLIVIDDVWDAIQGGYFLVGGPYCRTLITTREVPIANHLATRERTIRVDVLKPDAAVQLLRKLAPETARIDKKIVTKLCERLEFLPLGLTLAGRLLANEADVPRRMERLLGELLERREARLQLLQEEGRPGLDEENPVSLQAILGMSVERLSMPDQERFAMLSVFGGEPLTWELNAVSAIWECSMEETEATISTFIQRGLVEPHGKRYWMHALLADYAAELREKMDL